MKNKKLDEFDNFEMELVDDESVTDKWVKTFFNQENGAFHYASSWIANAIREAHQGFENNSFPENADKEMDATQD